MGLGGLALVAPERDDDTFRADARRLAVDASDVLDAMPTAKTIDELIGPATYLVATSAKSRRTTPVASPREAAPRLLEIARERPVALLFGREDFGLPAQLVQRAGLLLRLPSSASYPVLNVSQAVMLVAYELWVSSSEPTPDHAPSTASSEELDALHADAVRVLETIDYLKDHNRAKIIAELEELAVRATPSAREVNLLRGVCQQIQWLKSRRSD